MNVAVTQTHALIARRRFSASIDVSSTWISQKLSSSEYRNDERSDETRLHEMPYSGPHLATQSPCSRLLMTAAMMCQALSLSRVFSEVRTLQSSNIPKNTPRSSTGILT